MKEAGITGKSQSPAGGRIEMARGQPTGIFVDSAAELIDKVVPPPLPRTRDQALERAQQIMLSNGLTAAADMGTSPDDWLVMRRAGDEGRLKVRILAYGSGVDSALAIAGTRPTPWLYGDRLRLIGVKLYADGALGSRGAWLKQPYRDKPGDRGLGFVTDTEIAQSDEPGGDGQFPGRRPRHRRRRQRPAPRRDRGAGRHLQGRPALADRACPDRRSRPTCRASAGTASSPRCSRSTRPATGGWPRRGWGWSGSAAPMPGEA